MLYFTQCFTQLQLNKIAFKYKFSKLILQQSKLSENKNPKIYLCPKKKDFINCMKLQKKSASTNNIMKL